VAFSIPNKADAAFEAQAQLDSREVSDIIVPGLAGSTCVFCGCAVTAQGSPDMTVAVAVGLVRVGGTVVNVAAGNVTITAADGTNPRFDLICVNSSGTKSAVAGTASANPVFPDPAGKVVLAAVYVPANDTAINSNQISDKRFPAPPGTEIDYQQITATDTTTQTAEASADTVIAGATCNFDGTMAVIIDLYSAAISNDTGSVVTVMNLWEGGTDLGRVGQRSSAAGAGEFSATMRRTPGSSLAYAWKFWVNGASTGTVFATAPQVPSFLRVSKA
jgi:hypothetical protein